MQNLLLLFAHDEHLPPHLQTVSKPFGELARELAASLPFNLESSVALRKLLEARDCATQDAAACGSDPAARGRHAGRRQKSLKRAVVPARRPASEMSVNGIDDEIARLTAQKN
jgi:hypothetical protein